MHMNKFRGTDPFNTVDKRTVPDVVIHSHFKYFQPVTAAEGFGTVLRVNLTPCNFASAYHRALFYSFMIP